MKEYIKINQKAYSDLAREYKESVEKYRLKDKEITEPFIDYLKDNFKKIKLLELGPGSGLSLSYFEAEGLNTTAIDISEEIIEIAKELAPKTKYIKADFLEFDFGQLKFEGIYAKAFIHLFPKEDAKIVFQRIYNLLVNNGAIYIATTLHDKAEEGFFEKVDYRKKANRFRKKWTEEELLEEVKKAGFAIFRKYYSFEPDKDKKWINLIITKSQI